MSKPSGWVELRDWCDQEPGEAASEIQELRGLVEELASVLRDIRSECLSQSWAIEPGEIERMASPAIAAAERELATVPGLPK